MSCWRHSILLSFPFSTLFSSFSISTQWRPRSGRYWPSLSSSGHLTWSCRGNESETTWRCSRYQQLKLCWLRNKSGLERSWFRQHGLLLCFFRLIWKLSSLSKFIIEIILIAGTELPVTALGEFFRASITFVNFLSGLILSRFSLTTVQELLYVSDLSYHFYHFCLYFIIHM